VAWVPRIWPDSDREEVEGDVLTCLRLDIQHDWTRTASKPRPVRRA